MANLLGNNTILSDRSEISERWGQDGSEVVNIAYDNAVDQTIYTVTAGKTLFIKSLFIVVMDNSATTWIQLKDATGGSIRWLWESAANSKFTYISLTLDAPLVFNTEVYVNSNTLHYDVNLTGWEE